MENLTPKDLMVGDWVDCNNKYKVVEEIRESSVYSSGCSYFWRSVKPIPVTLEILEKNGFEKMEYNIIGEFNSCEWKDNIVRCKIYDVTDHMTAWITSYVESNVVHLPFCFNYVHELQHIFNICKIDKKFEL